MEFQCSVDGWLYLPVVEKGSLIAYTLLTRDQPKWLIEPSMQFIGQGKLMILREPGRAAPFATGMHLVRHRCHHYHWLPQIFLSKWLPWIILKIKTSLGWWLLTDFLDRSVSTEGWSLKFRNFVFGNNYLKSSPNSKSKVSFARSEDFKTDLTFDIWPSRSWENWG